MKKKKLVKILAISLLSVNLLSACATSQNVTPQVVEKQVELTDAEIAERFIANNKNLIILKDQGVFASGGTVTEPVEGEYDYTKNWQDATRKGTTAHVDHANTFYQVPYNDTELPMVFLHGYGQSRIGWQATPDGRDGWADMFLKYGHSVYLVDQPRRGEAGNTTTMTKDGFLDAWAEDSKEYKPGDQAWYTHFRIGKIAPDRYEGSQFPSGDEAQNQFFRFMTPNTGSFDVSVMKSALNEVLSDVRKKSGKKSIYITHSQGCTVGFNSDYKDVAALIFIEPGAAPAIDSDEFKKILDAKVPVAFYYGDYMEGKGPDEIDSTHFWQNSVNGAKEFAEAFNAAGGDCTVFFLPDEGITGNSHFMFEEMNNDVIAEHIENWIKSKNLA